MEAAFMNVQQVACDPAQDRLPLSLCSGAAGRSRSFIAGAGAEPAMSHQLQAIK